MLEIRFCTLLWSKRKFVFLDWFEVSDVRKEKVIIGVKEEVKNSSEDNKPKPQPRERAGSILWELYTAVFKCFN